MEANPCKAYLRHVLATPETLAAEPADDALALRAGTGDAAAMEALTLRYRDRVYAFVLGLLLRPEDAEDVTQETFVRVWRTLESYQPRGQFRAWLYRIAANLCRDHHRTARRRPQTVAPDGIEDVPASGGPSQTQEGLRTAVTEAIARLPSGYREVVALHYLEDLAPVEIAAILGRPRPAVRVQLWRARALLAHELADWLDER